MSSHLDQLEDYLAGKLNPEENQKLESALETDAELSQELIDLQTAKLMSKRFIEFETRQQLKQLNKAGHLVPWIFRIAALLLVCLGGIYLFKYFTKTPELNSQQVFASLYERPASASIRSESEQRDLLDTAIYHFDHSDLSQSKSELLQYLSITPGDEKAKRYLAHIYMQTAEYNLAEGVLMDLSSTVSYSFQVEAHYHLCMLYLMKSDRVKALSYYEKIKDNKLIPENKLKKLEDLLDPH